MADRTPVRTIARSGVARTGINNGLGRPSTPFEGDGEDRFVDFSTFDKRTKSITSQPFEIWYVDENGRWRSYIPDYLVEFHCARRPVLVDIKDARFLRVDRDTRLGSARKFSAGRAYAQTNGFVFRFITQRTLLRPVVANAVFLRPYQNRAVDVASIQRLVGRAALGDVETLGQLILSLAGESDLEHRMYWLTVLWHTIASFRLGIDLSQPLRMSSPIRWVENAPDDLGLLFWTAQRPW
jgi:TnsA endonuclease N terminal